MDKKRKLVILLSSVLAVIIFTLIVMWVKFGQTAQSYECTNFAMGTYVQQTVYGSKREAAAAAAAKSIGALENLISWRIENSDIAKLNAAAGTDWTTLDPKTIAILKKSLDVAQKSEGAFDPTILPISSLWDFGGVNQHVPSTEDIQKYLKYINYTDLRIDTQNSSASLKMHYMAVDLGAIGKGEACDVAVPDNLSAGDHTGLIEVDGSVGLTPPNKNKTIQLTVK